MSSQHFKNKKKSVALTLWVGDLSNRPAELFCIANNAKYFDEFYLITDRDQSNVLSFDKYRGFCQIVDKNICSLIREIAQKNLIEKLPDPFAPNYVSDILTYFPRYILMKLLDKDIEAVMYLDSDYLVYSKFLVRELFAYFTNNEFYLLKDNNYYCRYANSEYINSCWSLDSANVESDKAKWATLDQQIKKEPFTSYSCIGPHFTNSSLIASIADVAPLKPHTFDPRYVYEGNSYSHFVPGALGCHLAVTLPKEAGFIPTEVRVISDVISITFTNNE